MIRLVAALLLLAAGTMPAAAVTIDFEEFSVGDGPAPLDDFGFDWFLSNGYEFGGGAAPGCTQFGCPLEILIGDSGSNSLGGGIGWSGQDGFGALTTITMRQADGGAFAIHSLDLFMDTDNQGTMEIRGILAGGGTTFLLGVPVGTGDWLNLESVTFRAEGNNTGLGFSAVEVDNIVISAVPVPAAVWLFGSALAGLGWIKRKQNV